MIELRKVKTEDRDLLWNINQKYLYEMTNFYDDPMDEDGNFLSKHPGKWEIKYNEKNLAGKSLWNKVASPYNPKVHHLNEEETVLSFEVR